MFDFLKDAVEIYVFGLIIFLMGLRFVVETFSFKMRGTRLSGKVVKVVPIGAKASAPKIGTPAPAVTPETAQAMEQATSTYVDRLNELNELLLKIGAVSERLSIDSQEMENLNRTLTGIARVYEMQLKAASQQITTQDEINAETRKMADEIKELNAVYARMIDAMTVNIPKQQ